MDTGAKAISSQRAAENGLLLAVARGDVAALRELYRAFERPLYTLGIRWLQDPKMAEELVQEVTFRMWRRAGTFDPSRGAASSWIFGVARNVAADLARQRGHNPTPVADPPSRLEPWDEDSAWLSWQVSKALRSLPIEQQRVLELAYGLQMTQKEIAQALDIPLGTAKTRIYHGLRALRRTLVEGGMLEDHSP
jgi:RNA polymerase sigma-70 factor (ECF subfamily)